MVLRAFARAAKELLQRDTDFVIHPSGDEFILVLPNGTTHKADYIIAELRKRFALYVHQEIGALLTVTFTAAYATSEEFDGDTNPFISVGDLVSLADVRVNAEKIATKKR
jgi:GGDEF domain-containing protein